MSQSDLTLGDVIFRVLPVGAKKALAQFTIRLADLQLRHTWYSSQSAFSFTESDSGVVISFKAHLESANMMWQQLIALEDDEKLLAVQDLLEMARNGSGQLHTYLMDDQLLLSLLDLTRHWLHDAMFYIDIATLVPQLWRAIINSPHHPCIQYLTLDDGSVCDFFEYFVDSLLGTTIYIGSPAVSSAVEHSRGKSPSSDSSSSASSTGPSPNPAAPSSASSTGPLSSPPVTSPIFFNRERKLQLIHLFVLFLRKAVPSSFRSSFIQQSARLVTAVAKYVVADEVKSSTPKAAQEEFLAEILSPETYSTTNFGRSPPHATLLPVFSNILTNHRNVSIQLLLRVLNVLKVLPAPTQLEIVSNCNLVPALDGLTEHADHNVAKLADFNWSKYMLVLTSKAAVAHANAHTTNHKKYLTIDLSESGVASES